MESNMHNLKPVTKTVFPRVNKGRQASSNLVCQNSADFYQGQSPQKLSNKLTVALKYDCTRGTYQWGLLVPLHVFCLQDKVRFRGSSRELSFAPSELNVLRLWHFGKRLLDSQGREPGRRVVGPALHHEFPHLPQALRRETEGKSMEDVRLQRVAMVEN